VYHLAEQCPEEKHVDDLLPMLDDG
jgi:hypothetical protein